MTSYRDFEAIRIQTVAFSPKLDLQPTKVISLLLAEFSNKFDGDLQSIALPIEIPAEVPRAVLQSNDLTYRFEVGPGRLSSQWQSQGQEPKTTKEAIDECVRVLESCIKQMNPEIGRLALVISRTCTCSVPSETLIQRFCTEAAQKEPFNRSMNFEIHNHKQYVLPEIEPDLTINSWVRCKTARLSTTEIQAILVDQDLNTRPEDADSRRFNTNDIQQFFDVATREAEAILKKYFPG